MAPDPALSPYFEQTRSIRFACPALKDLRANGNPRALVIREVFDDAINYMKSGQLMRQVVNKLIDDFDINRSEDRETPRRAG